MQPEVLSPYEPQQQVEADMRKTSLGSIVTKCTFFLIGIFMNSVLPVAGLLIGNLKQQREGSSGQTSTTAEGTSFNPHLEEYLFLKICIAIILVSGLSFVALWITAIASRKLSLNPLGKYHYLLVHFILSALACLFANVMVWRYECH